MDKQTYEQLVDSAVQQQIVALLQFGNRATITEARLRVALDTLVQQVTGYTRDYELTNLATVDDLVERWDISKRRAQAIIADRHRRFGTGMKVGNKWLLSVAEIEQVEPELKYRRKVK